MSDEISSLKLRVDGLERTVQRLATDYERAIGRLEGQVSTLLDLLKAERLAALTSQVEPRTSRKTAGSPSPRARQKRGRKS
jgi:hypothetical protein